MDAHTYVLPLGRFEMQSTRLPFICSMLHHDHVICSALGLSTCLFVRRRFIRRVQLLVQPFFQRQRVFIDLSPDHRTTAAAAINVQSSSICHTVTGRTTAAAAAYYGHRTLLPLHRCLSLFFETVGRFRDDFSTCLIRSLFLLQMDLISRFGQAVSYRTVRIPSLDIGRRYEILSAEHISTR